MALIASDDERALGWHLARSENSRAWASLLSRMAAPEVVASDGGDGFAKALRRTWPGTRHQRCVFHAFSQARRFTTTRPRTQAGVGLYGLAKALLSITTPREAQGWIEAPLSWSGRWDGCLSETTIGEDGKARLAHERLVKARRPLTRLINAGTLFPIWTRNSLKTAPFRPRTTARKAASTHSSGPCSGTIGGFPGSSSFAAHVDESTRVLRALST